MTSAKAKRKKRSNKPKAVASSACEDKIAGFTDNVAHAESWDIAVNHLCQSLNFPDITSYRGLRETFDSFNRIYDALDKRITADDDLTVRAVVGVYAKIAVDWKIRDLLFERGVLHKLRPLLDRPFCRIVTLQAYAAITLRNAKAPSRKIEEETTIALLRLMDENPSDLKLVELCLTTLSQTSSYIFREDGPLLTKEMKRDAHVPEIIRAFVKHMKHPDSSYFLLQTGYEYLHKTVQHCAEELKDFPPAADWLLACLRSQDAPKRFQVLSSLQLFDFGADKDSVDYQFEKFHPSAFMIDNSTAYEYCTLESVEAPKDYGPWIPVLQFNPTIVHLDQVRDYDALGPVFADLILKSDTSFMDGVYLQEIRGTEAPLGKEVELRKIIHSEALLRCINALKKKSNHANREMLAVLEVEYHISKNHLKSAADAASDALDRFPCQPFFFYALSLIASSEFEVAYLLATRGLQMCNETTSPHLQFAFRRLIGSYAARFGTRLCCAGLPQAQDGIDPRKTQGKANEMWTMSVMLLEDAYNNLKIVINEKSERADMLLDALYWYTFVVFALKGDQLNDDLSEITEIAAKLEKFDKLYTSWYYTTPPASQQRLRCQTIISRLKGASEQWHGVLQRFDELHKRDPERTMPLFNKTVSQEALLSRMMRFPELMLPSGRSDRSVHISRRIVPNAVDMHLCSYCCNASASLRKCTRCGKARYCDPACQKKHWPVHRSLCCGN